MVIAEFSLDAFPATEQLKNLCGLPFGLTLQPFARAPHLAVDKEAKKQTSSQLPRCSECYSYINAYCGVDRDGFTCSLCGTYNPFSITSKLRYCRPGVPAASLPELCTNLIEVECEEPIREEEEEEHDSDALQWSLPEGVPVYIALVDTVCSNEFLDCVKTALAAALEAMPASAMFGLISFDDRVRMFDAKGPVPVCKSIGVMDDGPLLTPLEDIVALQRLLTPVGQFKDSILVALETLECSQGSPTSNLMDAPQVVSVELEMKFSQPSRGQCFGAALQGVLQYLHPLSKHTPQDSFNPSMAGKNSTAIRLLSFLNGPPTLAHGSVADYLLARESMRNKEPEKRSAETIATTLDMATSVELEMGVEMGVNQPGGVNPEDQEHESARSIVSSFYGQAALVAASMGVTIDLFSVGREAAGMEILASLPEHTGGGIWLYPTVVDAMMTQDLHRHISTPRAQSCLLRIRTSPEFKIARCYGNLFRDPVYEDLFHIISCDPFETVAFDFQYKNGFSASAMIPPTLQIAFQYRTPVFSDGEFVKHERKMRICTLQRRIAENPGDVYQGVKSGAVASLLLHKSRAAVKTEGQYRAALLLQDWLVILAANYMQNKTVSHGGHLSETTQGDFSLPFDGLESLQLIPRLVYGLLRSPLLLGSLVTPTESQDYAVFLEHLWTSLPPYQLQRAAYPSLSSYSTPEKQALPLHSLSNLAIDGSDAPIFLLDAFTTVLVYFKSSCPPETEFPPPRNSLLRSTVNDMRQNRRLAPQYRVLKEGDPGEALFRSFMCDEPMELGMKLEGEAAASFGGYKKFLEWLKVAAVSLLDASRKA
ncbi:hypothetical protein BSKO_01252 [Bryopsis sp. KO-2023]|nr:hypothetical protein BSKO_01252 [Bryopsis sp. KO-2023]